MEGLVLQLQGPLHFYGGVGQGRRGLGAAQARPHRPAGLPLLEAGPWTRGTAPRPAPVRFVEPSRLSYHYSRWFFVCWLQPPSGTHHGQADDDGSSDLTFGPYSSLKDSSLQTDSSPVPGRCGRRPMWQFNKSTSEPAATAEQWQCKDDSKAGCLRRPDSCDRGSDPSFARLLFAPERSADIALPSRTKVGHPKLRTCGTASWTCCRSSGLGSLRQQQ